MDKQIKITMLKEFLLEFNNQIVPFDQIASRQMTSLLQILIYHRNGISKEELIDTMWQDNNNPQNALKYSIFRLRATLDEIECFKGVELVATTKNGYIFAPDFEIVSDFVAIDDQWKIITDTNKTKHENFESAVAIITLYKGPFFINESSLWTMQVRSYYQNIYEKALVIACEEFMYKKKFEEILSLVQQAIDIDKFNEDAYEFYMKALIELGEFNKAMQLYKQINELYENEFGHAPSLKIKSLYRVLSSREEEVIDVHKLKNKLNANMQDLGALYCEYDTFKFIYHVLLQNAKRDRKKQFLIIFQLNCEKDDKIQQQYMTKLKTILCSALRSGDVLSKINQSQIIAILPCETLDNGYTIIQRATSMFYKKTNKEKATVHYFISSLNDFDGIITKK